MGSRTHDTTRRAWWNTRLAALCPALVVLLAALVVCLGYAAHGDSAPVASMTTVSTTATPTAAPAGHHLATAAHPADCPPGDVCCGAVGDSARAVLVAPAQLSQAILPRMPDLPRQPDTPTGPPEAAQADHAPDLHVLQVQRT